MGSTKLALILNLESVFENRVIGYYSIFVLGTTPSCFIIQFIMKNNFILYLFIWILTGCDTPSRQNNTMAERDKKNPNQEIMANDTTPKVTGVGGIFFFSDNPKETKTWYADNLGLEINEYGSTFEVRNANRPEEINYLQWSAFKSGHEYFAPSKREFMINYRVQNLEALIEKLKKNGVTILDTIEEYDYGKFVHIMDPDGTKLELWEPVDSVLTSLGGKTTK